MKVRKSLFAVSVVGLLFAGPFSVGKAVSKVSSRPAVADGTDPVPRPYPKPTRGGLVVADGADPVPLPYPKPTRGGWVADGTDPVPLPYPHRVV
jgi:hypothetical protein